VSPAGCTRRVSSSKAACAPRDRLFLSKPLGTGVVTTAAKNDQAPADVLEAAIRSMLRLNRVAARVALEHGAAGATDVTGFGLLGHAGEMVEASRAGLVLEASRLPSCRGCARWPRRPVEQAACSRNRRWVDDTFGGRLQIDRGVPGCWPSLVTESETSGGCCSRSRRSRAGVLDAFRRSGEECWEIGSAIAEPVIRVLGLAAVLEERDGFPGRSERWGFGAISGPM